MSNRERVLVVDEVSDVAEVLEAVFEPRGLTVNRVRRLGDSECPGNGSRPAVVVLAAHSQPESGDRSRQFDDVPQVIIGQLQHRGNACDGERKYLSTPFQYAELVQAIETLIARRPMGAV